MSLCGVEIDLCGASHLFNETYSPNKEELGNTSSSPRASVISTPEPFTYAIYIVIAFVLEVLYLAITLLLALLSIKVNSLDMQLWLIYLYDEQVRATIQLTRYE